MDSSLLNNNNRQTGTKTVYLAAFAICATLAVSFLVFNGNSSTQVMANQRIAQDLLDELSLFDGWKQQYNVEYEDADEESHRFDIFRSNLQIIINHNQDPEATFTMGLTQFADLSQKEFKDTYLGFNKEAADKRNKNYRILEDVQSPPGEWNWTAKGAVTEVKNQAKCGSCWSFSASGSTEGLSYLKTGVLRSFSEQQIMDCSYTYGNKACKGGIMDQAFEYLIAKGDMLEHDYPYTGNASLICKYKKNMVRFRPTGYYDVVPKNLSQLTAAVLQQPVSIAVQADQVSWQFYTGGVITSNCGQHLDHGVLLTGYGTDKYNYNAWYVKNSWGPFWGENGYLRIERNDKNICGVMDQPSYPTAGSN